MPFIYAVLGEVQYCVLANVTLFILLMFRKLDSDNKSVIKLILWQTLSNQRFSSWNECQDRTTAYLKHVTSNIPSGQNEIKVIFLEGERSLLDCEVDKEIITS